MHVIFGDKNLYININFNPGGGKKMQILKQEKGFTLIELVMIIVIVAILAAIAVPKYVDMSNDAEVAAAASYQGSLRAAAAITYANCVLKGTDTNDIDITSVLNGLEEAGGLAVSGTNYFTNTINAKTYRWEYTSPMSVGLGGIAP